MNPLMTPSGPMMQPQSQVFLPSFPQVKSEATLYVGNLHPAVSSDILFHEFAPFGQIVSARVMKNAYTKESRCFAFVTYSDPAAAARAQREMNAKEVYKREIRVHFKKNTKNLSNEANFIIKNLAKNVTSKQLNEECAKFGDIVSCFVRRDEDSDRLVSLGYGYVQFERAEDGARFLEEFNGREINGQKIQVERFVSQKNRDKDECKNLYVKNFPAAWDQPRVEQFLDAEFAKFGAIDSKGVYECKQVGKFYAFVAFQDPKVGFEAVRKLHNLELEGEKLYVVKAQSKGRRKAALKKERQSQTQTNNLYVRSIRAGVTVEQFKAAFAKYGPITSVCLKEWVQQARPGEGAVVPEAPAVPLQFGFINFENAEDSQRVLMEYKKDAEIKALVSVENNANFIFLAQTKEMRLMYLSMQKRMKDTQRANFMHQAPFPPKNFKGKRFHNPMVPMMGGVPQFMPGYPMPGQMMAMNQGILNPLLGQLPVQVAQPPTVARAASDAPQGPTDYKKLAEELRRNQKDFQQKSSDQQKEYLGNIMYNRVKSFEKNEQLIPKITGMLIDTEVLEFEEILEIIENDKSLKERIEEAIEVINENAETGDKQEE